MINFSSIKLVFFVMLLGLSNQIISAQFNYDSIAVSAAQRLKNGALIVRFPVYAPKIRFLKNKLSAAKSDKSRTKIQKQLQEVYVLNDYKFHLLYSIMEKEFRFTQVFFMPDSLYKSFVNGNRNVFLDKDGKIDTHITFSKDYFLMISGEHDDQWVIVDDQLNIPEPPFPHRIIVFLSGLRRVFAREKYYQLQIKGLNKKLFKLVG